MIRARGAPLFLNRCHQPSFLGPMDYVRFVLAFDDLFIDHEYLRDLLFRATAGLQRADFFQGGHQTGTTAGLGITWVMNRNARLSFTYDQTDLRGSSIPKEALATGSSSGVGLLTLRLSL